MPQSIISARLCQPSLQPRSDTDRWFNADPVSRPEKPSFQLAGAGQAALTSLPTLGLEDPKFESQYSGKCDGDGVYQK